MKERFEKIGSKSALLIGLPIGILFSIFVLIITLFPMIDFGIMFIGGQIFWNPIIWGGLIPLVFIFLLWNSGKKIDSNLRKNFSKIKTSFLFTIYINIRLFSLIGLLFIIGAFLNHQELNNTSSIMNIIGISLVITILTFIVATIITTFTIGLGIIKLTSRKISAAVYSSLRLNSLNGIHCNSLSFGYIRKS
jgi:hypothetical protein